MKPDEPMKPKAGEQDNVATQRLHDGEGMNPEPLDPVETVDPDPSEDEDEDVPF